MTKDSGWLTNRCLLRFNFVFIGLLVLRTQIASPRGKVFAHRFKLCDKLEFANAFFP